MSAIRNGGGGFGRIIEARVSDCWTFDGAGKWAHDIALLYFDRPIDNAVEGVDYLPLWDPAEHDEDLVG